MRTTLFAAALAVALAHPAWTSAREELPQIKVHSQMGVPYVSGGADDLNRKALRRISDQYPLQLVFSKEGSDAPVTGVKVTLRDIKGNPIVEAVSEGPLFFLNPPGGRWTIEAELDGQVLTHTVDLMGRQYQQVKLKFGGTQQQ
ncbi:MAG TPA: hypothetical protein VMH32_01435 [Burkholderiales bacterium]|nr:hypothetical protein [Burkholderiales bacterium]